MYYDWPITINGSKNRSSSSPSPFPYPPFTLNSPYHTPLIQSTPKVTPLTFLWFWGSAQTLKIKITKSIPKITLQPEKSSIPLPPPSHLVRTQPLFTPNFHYTKPDEKSDGSFVVNPDFGGFHLNIHPLGVDVDISPWNKN